MTETRVCAGCGAKLRPDAEVCDLCGWTVAVDDTSDIAGETAEAADDGPGGLGGASGARAMTEEEVDAVGSGAAARAVGSGQPDAGARSVFLVAAAAALLVAGLYLITVVSRSNPQPAESAVQAPSMAPPPLAGEAGAEADELRSRIDQATGLDQVELQRALVGLYVRENRLDLAGEVQQNVAATLQSEIEWVRTGNLYYDWMELQGGALRTAYARKAITAYERALEINPDNLDARTDMALAYFYDPQRPMEAIRNITMVLEADSTHIQANYNRGYLLFQIGRYEQALEQFEKVLRLVDNPQDPIYRRAESAISTVRQRVESQ